MTLVPSVMVTVEVVLKTTQIVFLASSKSVTTHPERTNLII